MRRVTVKTGFTLVEVLAAVAILATAVLVLLDAHYSAMRLHETMQEAADYRQMLETTCSRAEVEVMQGTLSGGGDFGARHPEYTWSYDAVLMGKEGIELYEVTARVTGPEEEQMRTFLVYAIKAPEEGDGSGMFDSKRNTSGAGKTNSNTGGRNTGSGGDSGSGGRGSNFGSGSRSRSGSGMFGGR